jgi:RHS repeat-associated protein
VVKKGSTLEYQYAITDYQGNTRVVFTSAAQPSQVAFTDFETESDNEFQNYPTGSHRSQVPWYNHTSPAPPNTSSQLLTGAAASQVGVAKNIKVYPGDKISIEAYAKYFSGGSGTGNLGGFAAALTGAFGLTSISTGEAAKAYGALNDYGTFVSTGAGPGQNSHPKAFVNILLFDKDFKFLDIAYEQIDGGEQPVGSTTKTAHDHMMREYTVKETGYAYVYISNESAGGVDVYFDDVAITYTPTRVIQYSEYYPYGLQTAGSWTRENNSNNFLYNQGSELNPESGWYETAFRNYDPVLGRFMQVDPLATKYGSLSSYHYAFDNPVMFNDPSGAEGIQPGPPDGLYDQMAEIYGSRYAQASSYVNGGQPGFYDGPSSSWMAPAYGELQSAAAYNSASATLAAARNGDMDAVREYGRRNGDLVRMERFTYEGGTIIDGLDILMSGMSLDAGEFAAAMATLNIESSGPFTGTRDDVTRKIKATQLL